MRFVPLDRPSVAPASTSTEHCSANSPLKQGVLGATGSVGQRFILLLQSHPFLKLVAVGASPQSAGKKYRDAVKWKQSTPMGEVGDLVVKECKSSEFKDCDIVFSGLDANIAGDVGTQSLPVPLPAFLQPA